MTNRSVSILLNRLSKAGFKPDFVRPAILPDWWDDSLNSDTSMVSDIELRVARFLGLSIADVRDPSRPLSAVIRGRTVLRRVSKVDESRIAPAVHAARRVAEAVARNLKSQVPRLAAIPGTAEKWRSELTAKGPPVQLSKVLIDLWARGIPVVPIDRLPTPAFQAMATVVDGRPIIVIGQKYDAPGRVAFFVAHEVGHIFAGDCEEGESVVDGLEEPGIDSSTIERRADQYATQALIGDADLEAPSGSDPRILAAMAARIERETGAEAGALIFHWARKSNDYQTASLAAAAVYRNIGARRLLLQQFLSHVDTESASDTDRALLGLVPGDVATSD